MPADFRQWLSFLRSGRRGLSMMKYHQTQYENFMPFFKICYYPIRCEYKRKVGVSF